MAHNRRPTTENPSNFIPTSVDRQEERGNDALPEKRRDLFVTSATERTPKFTKDEIADRIATIVACWQV